MIMVKKKVQIYTTNVCPWCIKAKEFFKENKISYTEKNVQKDPKLADELLEKSGQMGVPVIVIDGKAIIGFNKERLKKVLGL
jgi:glutaredoxin-like YruB-family protein